MAILAIVELIVAECAKTIPVRVLKILKILRYVSNYNAIAFKITSAIFKIIR